LSSSNYDDTDKRTGAGVNGLGATAANIFSKKFIVETVDSISKKKYYQEFSENMSVVSKPKITKCSTSSYTRITFTPDYPRFGMKKLGADALALLSKRVYDTIACTDKRVSVSLNDKVIKGKGLADYAKYFFDEGKTHFESVVSNGLIWEYAVLPYNSFQGVSFVNGNCTYQGGKHVDYILYQITSKLKTMIEAKKKLKDIKPASIKDRLFLFLRATVINPQFNSQSKEQLVTQSKDFGCKIEVSDAFITKLYKSSIVDEIVEFHNLKTQSEMKKKTDGVKKSKVFIPNLEDAHLAGGPKSKMCTLILTEGLSAKTFAMWGRNNADYFGIFPLKGKLLNIRDATAKQLLENEEINNIKQIIGLKQNVKYKDTSELRYGKVLCLTDSDNDGYHIKGLIINLFHVWWPSLLHIDFIKTLRTPIVKVIKGKKTIEFFTEQDYHTWSMTNTATSTKYFKGLGTSKKDEAKDIFNRIESLKIDYVYKDSECDDAILLAFGKDKGKIVKGQMKITDKRKEWIADYNKDSYIQSNETKVSYNDMINKELIHFSVSDNIRSIPSICDGLKPSQRKILFYMLKKNIVKDIKVSQLSGYISAETSYHHGEVSLQGAIITMAQDFIGKNNINLLLPKGNFGSRYLGGKDAASSRYIFTCLNPKTLELFNGVDSKILTYKIDDGVSVEPEYYIPILPMVLVNGCEGIGTGYSTNVPPHNPKDLVEALRCKISGKECKKLEPFFNGFKGKVLCLGDGKYTTHGLYTRKSSTSIEITELPVGAWVSEYKEFLEGLVESKTSTLLLKDVTNNTVDENSDIRIVADFKTKAALDDLVNSETLEKELKLVKPFSTNNMYLFDSNGKMKRYATTNDILDEYYNVRLKYYETRRLYQIKVISSDLLVLQNKYRFIQEYISGDLVINKQSRVDIEEQLVKRKYIKVDNSYGYLVNMPIISMTTEKMSDLENIIKNTKSECEKLESSTCDSLWLEELECL
jgi:DNA topoisomerase-2